MLAFEPVLLEQEPELVLVVGDVNSTLACALVYAKIGVRAAHLEAGLRSFDPSTMLRTGPSAGLPRAKPRGSGQALPDAAGEHRATGDSDAGDEHGCRL